MKPVIVLLVALGIANIKTKDTYLNATRIGLQESMRKYGIPKNLHKLAQTDGGSGAEEERSDPVTESEVACACGTESWRGRRDSNPRPLP